MQNKRVLVTGGAGAIGSRLANRLAPDNEVVIVDDLSSGYAENLDTDNLRLVEGSILEADLMFQLFVDFRPQIVFHFAALFANQNSVEHPEKDLETNGMGTLRMFELSKAVKVERVIYASSSCVYGHQDGDLVETCREFNVDTPYAITKLLGERYSEFFHQFHDLPTTTLRFFNSYGPGERPGRYRNVVPNFLWLAMKGEPLPITGTGEETRDFTYIEDVVLGAIAAADSDATIGEIINLGSGRETSIRELAEEVNRITGNKAGIELHPRRDWDLIPRRRANIEKANELFGYDPAISLRDGLRATHDWIQGLPDNLRVTT